LRHKNDWMFAGRSQHGMGIQISRGWWVVGRQAAFVTLS